jgi:hypothetical protein
MHHALRSLLEQSIDYAGMFPPARLSLDQAVQNDAGYRAGPHAWLMGRFVCPIERLDELILDWHDAESRGWTISAVLPTCSELDRFFEQLDAHLESIRALRQRAGRRSIVASLELRLPHTPLSSPPRFGEVKNIIGRLRDRLLLADVAPIEIFVERPNLDPWRTPERIRLLMQALVEFMVGNHRRNEPTIDFAFKLRTGGPEPGDVPSGDEIAAVLMVSRAFRLRWKATAGLHQPLADASTESLGFLSLFAASVFWRDKLVKSDQNDLLQENDASGLRFDDERLRWRNYQATIDQIREARSAGLISFGSCSFDEPCEGLARMGLLDEAECDMRLPALNGAPIGGEP